jgi:serine/threonine protein kinase
MSSKNIGHYELIKEIGRGGMATVYLARDKKHKRLVAYKLLAVHFQDDPTFHARFKREVITFARLEHDAIVPLYDSDDNPEEDSPPYLVMRFMKGGDLQ